MTLITSTSELNAFCERQKDAPFVTVDTEFLRETTYWPKLCLVQVGGPHEAVAIDPLAPGMDLTALFDLLKDGNILKVFHAARQDLEIFYHIMGQLPAPVFDTQVAAMVCGFGDSVGYEGLVTKLVNARIDKSSRFTDWSLRPLSERQLTYALSDVTHLRDAYRKLKKKLEKTGRESWLDDEMAVLLSPQTYDADPMVAYKRIKVRNPKPRALAVLRELAAWRENECRRRDLTRNRILRDDPLVEIALHAPKTVKDLARTRGLSAKQAEGEMGRHLLKAVERGLAVPDQDCPRRDKRPDMPSGLGPVCDLLKVLLKLRSEESEVATKLLANAADIEKIAAFGAEADVPALKGWRAEVFGNDALKMRDGGIAVRIEGKRLALVDVSES